MEKTYTVTINWSSRPLRAIEKSIIKTGIDSFESITEAVKDGERLRIDEIDYAAIVQVHNENAKRDTDYSLIVIKQKDGITYKTGSASFIRTFEAIWDDILEMEEDEKWALLCYSKKSKNYDGDFVTCALTE